MNPPDSIGKKIETDCRGKKSEKNIDIFRQFHVKLIHNKNKKISEVLAETLFFT